MRFNSFIETCNNLPSDTEVTYKSISPSIEFSNTGRRGGRKYFSITLISLITVIKDIRDNLDKFSPYTNYVEDTWRNLFSTYISDSAVNALSTVQTLPLFTTIAKIIHVVNLPKDKYIDKVISLNEEYLTATINYLESQLPDEDLYLATENTTLSPSSKGENIIYYGAPGTGKSHTIDHEIDELNTVRTVFHADTQNSDFIGSLKPIMDNDSIKYEFRPGPFTNAMINAINDPNHHHWLVIEEINRAPAAAVFGEIFQLLDRDAYSGTSRYNITLSDLDMKSYIEDKINKKLGGGKLQLPGNLTVLATMNSSDQAVMPLDTAFKRRWKFRYIPLDFEVSYKENGKPCAEGSLLITDKSGSVTKISWKNFATTINKILTSNGIPEDRHLGPFFLSEKEMEKDEQKEALTGKLFMYLWDDLLRHGMADKVFKSEIKTYGQLTRCYDNQEQVFNDNFYEILNYEQNEPAVYLEVAEEEPSYDPE